MIKSLDEEEKRILNQLVEDGVHLSAEKLARLSNTVWDVLSSSVDEIAYPNILSLYRREEDPYFGAHLRSNSMLPLEILVLFPGSSMNAVAEAVAQANSDQIKDIPDRMRVVIAEVSNILGQGIIRAMVDALRVSVILTVPKLMEGSKSDILTQALSSFNPDASTLILTRVEMRSGKLNAECNIALIVDTGTLRRLLKVSCAD